MRVAGPCVDATERADVDDAAVHGTEIGQRFARGEKGTASVGFEDGVPLRQGEGFERGRFEDGCVVDEDVDAVVEGCGSSDGVANRGLGANITGDGLDAAAQGFDGLGGDSGFSC